MRIRLFSLCLIAGSMILVHCVAKKPAVVAEKSIPAPNVEVLEPVPVEQKSDTSQLKIPVMPEETHKMLVIAEGVEHGATQYWLNQGKEILNVQCASCHKTKDPLKYDEAGWVKHMSRMVPKAKLTEDQAKFLRVYTLTLIRKGS